MDELEAFEKRLKAKREAKLLTEQAKNDSTNTDLNTNFSKDANTNIENTTATNATNSAAAEEVNVDELEEYLKNLKLREQQQEDEKAKKAANSVNTSSSAPMNFALLLYWFLAILNLASATFVCKHCSFGF